jgi:D-alanyl-D-alanine carboxypeptidase
MRERLGGCRIERGRFGGRSGAVLVMAVITGCGMAPGSPATANHSRISTPSAVPLGSFPPLSSRALAPELGARLQKQLDVVVDADEAPAISASVILPGTGRWEGTSGTTPEGEAVPSDTVFAIASITKTIIAAAALRLSEEGVLDLDDPLADHLPPEIAELTNDATLRDALGMRTGLQEHVDPTTESAFVDDPDRHWTPEEAITVLTPAAAFPPDERTMYANVNYLLVGMAIEGATGRSMDALLREGVLARPELARIVLQDAEPPSQPLSASYPENPALASGAESIEVGGGFLPSRAIASAVWTAGSMASDAPTLATWGYLLYGGHVLSDESLAAMVTMPDGADYGLGCVAMREQGLDGVGHGGVLPGFSSVLYADEETGAVIAVLVNTDGYDPAALVSALMREIRP